MLVKYYLSDNIKAPFENFALGLGNAWASPAKSHRFRANEHSYKICSVVSSFSPQNEHFRSICTFHEVRLDFVGRILQHTLHIKV